MKRLRAGLLVASLALLAAFAVPAHDGVEHGAEAASEAASEPANAPAADLAGSTSLQAPRIAFSTPQLEVLIVREPAALVIHVDDYATNAPLTGLQLSLQSGAELVAATPAADGSYRVPNAQLAQPLTQVMPLQLRLRGEGINETLRGELPAATEASAEAAAHAEPHGPRVAGAAALLGLGLIAGFALRLRRRR